MDGYAYIRQRVEWTRLRLAALESMEDKLREMKALVELARDHSLDAMQIERVNIRIGLLQAEVNGLDDQTREFHFTGDLQ